MKNKAFTLAETLVTLVITGIIAALTIPGVIKNYQKHETEVKLKKAFVILNEAFNMAKIEHGNPITWDWSESYSNCSWGGYVPTKIFKLIKPHLKITKDYMGTITCGGRGTFTAKTISGTNVNMEHQYLLQDGVALSFYRGGYSWSTDPWVWIRVDLNGAKGPNVIGRDIFNLYYYAKKGFYSAYNVSSHTRCLNYSRNSVLYECKAHANGTCCADLIMSNGWKIPEDYPW